MVTYKLWFTFFQNFAEIQYVMKKLQVISPNVITFEQAD